MSGLPRLHMPNGPVQHQIPQQKFLRNMRALYLSFCISHYYTAQNVDSGHSTKRLQPARGVTG